MTDIKAAGLSSRPGIPLEAIVTDVLHASVF